MSLKHVEDLYENYGKTDPLYAVLSDKDKKGNRWDVKEFFRTGCEEIGDALRHVEGLGLSLRRDAALDFGCGVGRLAQALCDEFVEVSGVDISSSMIEHARNYNRHGERCRYHVNTTDDLALFEDGTFDFVYTNIVLQHVPPEASCRYIADFFRILKPGGVALFQIPSGARYEPGSVRESFYNFTRGPMKRLWKRMRGKPPVEMHQVARSRVEEIIKESGGRLVDAEQFGSVRRTRTSFRYCAVRN